MWAVNTARCETARMSDRERVTTDGSRTGAGVKTGRRRPAMDRQEQDVRTVDAAILALGYLEDDPNDGWPVILSHGFPFDVHTYDEVVPLLTARGARVIRPWLRGFGPTRSLTVTA